MVNYAKKIVSEASIVFIFTLLAGAMGFMAKLVMVRFFTTQEIGLFFATFSLIALVSLFKDFGINSAIQKYIPEYTVHKKEEKIRFAAWFAVIFSLIASTVISIILFLMRDFLAEVFIKDEVASVLITILLVYLMVSKLESVFTSLLMATHRVQAAQNISFIDQFALLPLIPLLAFLGVQGIGYAYVLSVTAGAVVGFIILRKRVFTRPPHWQKGETKKYFAYGLPLTFYQVVIGPAKFFDILFLTYFGTLSDVGVYSVVYWLPMILVRLAGAFGKVLVPRSSEMLAKNMKETLAEGLRTLYKYLTWVVVPLVVMMIIFAKEIIYFLYGQDYMVGAVVVQIIAFAIIFQSMTVVNASILKGSGKVKVVAAIAIISSVVNVGLNIVLIPKYGMVGAAITTLVQYLVVFGYAIFKTKQIVNVAYPWVKAIVIFFGGIVFGLVATVLSGIEGSLYWVLPLATFVGGLVYLGITLSFGAVTIPELKNLLSLLLKKDDSKK